MIILIALYKRFQSLVRHDHESVPGHVHEQRGREGAVEGRQAFVLKRVLEDLAVREIGVDLRTLFEHVEGRHDEVVEKTGDAATGGESHRPDTFFKLFDMGLVEFVNSEE